MKYRIVKTNYHNEIGKITYTEFHVEKLDNKFGFDVWKRITHKESSWTDQYEVTTTFTTEEKAQAFINDILCTNAPRQKHVQEVVSYSECLDN